MAKSKRVKSDNKLLPVENWRAADRYVRQIGALQLKIESQRQSANNDINVIKNCLAVAIKPHQEKIDILTKSLEAFCVNNKNDFGNAKSKKLNFGILGFRKSTVIAVKKQTLELIEKIFGRKAEQYLHVKKLPDKEALTKLTDDQLASVGARRRVRDDFFVEPDTPEAVDYAQ